MGEQQRKICLCVTWVLNDTRVAACGAHHRPPHAAIVDVEDFARLPRQAQCDGCANAVQRGSTSLVAREWPLRRAFEEIGHTYATRDPILSVALFCCALHGSIDPTMDALIREENPIAALDLAEQRGYEDPQNLPRAEVEWPAATGHEHGWLPWQSGEDERALNRPARGRGAPIRRCTCGLFEHEAAAQARYRAAVEALASQRIDPERFWEGRGVWSRQRLLERVRVRMRGRTCPDDVVERAIEGGIVAAAHAFERTPIAADPDLHAELVSLHALVRIGERYLWPVQDMDTIRRHLDAVMADVRRLRTSQRTIGGPSALIVRPEGTALFDQVLSEVHVGRTDDRVDALTYALRAYHDTPPV